MRAATRKRGHYHKRGQPVPGATMVHVIEMLRRRTMFHANGVALVEMRQEYEQTLAEMVETGEMPRAEAEGIAKQLTSMPLWREQQRHGTTGKLIPLRKEFPDGIG